jgi:hypothetical protein
MGRTMWPARSGCCRRIHSSWMATTTMAGAVSRDERRAKLGEQPTPAMLSRPGRCNRLAHRPSRQRVRPGKTLWQRRHRSSCARVFARQGRPPLAGYGPLPRPGMAGHRGAQLGAEPLFAVELVGRVRSAGIGYHSSRLGLVRSAGAIGPSGAVGVAAVGAAGALAGQPVAALGPSDDRPGAGGGPAGVAFAVQLDHHVGTQDGVLLLPADPLI